MELLVLLNFIGPWILVILTGGLLFNAYRVERNPLEWGIVDRCLLLLALAVALEEAGHEVVLAAPPERAPWVRAHGIAFHALGRDVTAFLDRMSCAHSPAAALRFVFYLRKELSLQFDRLEHAIEGADLALGSSLAFALATVVERRCVPYRFIAFTPQLIPSRAHPFMAFKTQGLPAWWNRSTWRMVSVADRFNLNRLINRCRRELGLPPIRDERRHILGPKVIVASDRAVGAVPPDAGIPSVQTGREWLRSFTMGAQAPRPHVR